MRQLCEIASVIATFMVIALANGTATGQCHYEVTATFGVPDCNVSTRWSNEHAEVVGAIRCGLLDDQAYFWIGVVVPVPVPAGASRSNANDMTDDRVIVGCASINQGGISDVAFVFDGVESRALGVLPGHNFSEAEAINEDGVIVGHSLNNVTGPVSAVAWIDGEIVDLTPLLLDMPWSTATDINERTQVVGDRSVDGFADQRAFLLDLETKQVVDVGIMPGGTDGKAKAVNNRGQVVATGRHTKSGQPRSFFWSSGTSTDIGVLPDRTRTFAYDVNDRAMVVGTCDGGGSHGFLWHEGSLYALDDLTIDATPHIVAAHAITNDGRIIGLAKNGVDTIGVVLTPVDRPAGDATGDCAADFRDLLLVLAEWGECEFCIADLNADGRVGMADLLLVLQTWNL